jgi:hypothetical protein
LRQQSLLFALQLANERLKLIHDLLALSASNCTGSRLQSLGPAQIDSLLCELDFLSSQPFEGRKPTLLVGVIHRQFANGGQMLFCA